MLSRHSLLTGAAVVSISVAMVLTAHYQTSVFPALKYIIVLTENIGGSVQERLADNAGVCRELSQGEGLMQIVAECSGDLPYL